MILFSLPGSSRVSLPNSFYMYDIYLCPKIYMHNTQWKIYAHKINHGILYLQWITQWKINRVYMHLIKSCYETVESSTMTHGANIKWHIVDKVPNHGSNYLKVNKKYYLPKTKWFVNILIIHTTSPMYNESN